MKTCSNCYFFDNCNDDDKAEGRCEYYCPLIGYENIALKEYEADLKMRAEEYQQVVEEQQN